MHRFRHRLRQPALAAIAVSALMAGGLAACGGSSDSSTTATQANAAATSTTSRTTTSATGTTSKSPPRRLSAVRECLQRNGVKLPSGRGAGGLFLGGGLPKGVTRAQLQSAMRKCLGGAGRPPAGGGERLLRTGSPRLTQALSNFAACMRRNGVNVPSPNTSGNGPVFSTKGLNTSSAQFRTAAAKCRPQLTAGFGRLPKRAG